VQPVLPVFLPLNANLIEDQKDLHELGELVMPAHINELQGFTWAGREAWKCMQGNQPIPLHISLGH